MCAPSCQEMLLEFFNYTHPIYEDLNSFPACYTKVPFHFRNAVDDEAPPYPLGDMLTEAGESALGTPDKKSPPRTRPTAATGYSPSRRRMRPPDTVDSPLAARSPNVGGEEQPPLKRRRARASPSGVCLRLIRHPVIRTPEGRTRAHRNGSLLPMMNQACYWCIPSCIHQ